jgi:hypothetical protein
MLPWLSILVYATGLNDFRGWRTGLGSWDLAEVACGLGLGRGSTKGFHVVS